MLMMRKSGVMSSMFTANDDNKISAKVIDN